MHHGCPQLLPLGQPKPLRRCVRVCGCVCVGGGGGMHAQAAEEVCVRVRVRPGAGACLRIAHTPPSHECVRVRIHVPRF